MTTHSEPKFSLEYKYGFWSFGRGEPFEYNPYDKSSVEGANWESGWVSAKNKEVKEYEF